MTITKSDASPRKGLRILFIGNSYTQAIRRYFTGLANAGRTDAVIEWITQGGFSISEHAEEDAVINAVETGEYNVVVLQDQSKAPTLPDYEEQHLPAIRKLNDLILKSGGETVLYMTWGRKNGDLDNSEIFPDDNYEKMQNRLIEGYTMLGAELNAKVAPVGIAWSKLVDEIDLYREDEAHPSSAGGYLASCVLYNTIFESSPTSIAYKGDVKEEVAEMVRETAAAAVSEYTGAN
jgi:hypothetical protein